MQIKNVHIELIQNRDGSGIRIPVTLTNNDFRDYDDLPYKDGVHNAAKYYNIRVRPVLAYMRLNPDKAFRGVKTARAFSRAIERYNEAELTRQSCRFSGQRVRNDAFYVTGLFCVYVTTDTGWTEFYGVMDPCPATTGEDVLKHLMTYIPISMRVYDAATGQVRTQRSLGDGVHSFDFTSSSHYDALRAFLKVWQGKSTTWVNESLADAWEAFCQAMGGPTPPAVKLGGHNDWQQGLVNHIRRVVLAEPFRADRPVGYFWRKAMPLFDFGEFYFENQIFYSKE